MTIIFERETLHAALSALHGISDAKSAIPILSCLKIEASGSKATISSHSLDHCASVSISAEVSEPAAMAIDAARLHSLVGMLPQGSTVTLKTSANSADLTCTKSRYKLPILPATDFPNMLAPSGKTSAATLTPDIASNFFKRTVFAVGKEPTRSYLMGCYLHAIDGTLASCATDAVALALSRCDVPHDGNVPGIIIPDRAMAQIAKMAEDEITLTWSDQIISAECGGVTYASKLREGTYPDYQRIVPDGNQFLETGREELIDALERLDAIDADGPAFLEWEAKNGTASVSRDGTASGSEEIEITAQGKSGHIPFINRQIIPVLSSLSGDIVRIYLAKDKGPVRVTDPNDANYTAVIMPAWLWKKGRAAAA